MPPTLTIYRDVTEYAATAAPFLMRHEAANTLPLGLITALEGGTSATTASPFMATANAGAEVVAVFLRTPPYRLIITTGSDPAALPALAEHLAAASPDLPGVNAPEELARAFAATWAATTGANTQPGRPLGIYALRQVIPPAKPAGGLRQATLADRDLLVAWFLAFHEELHANEPATPDILSGLISARVTNPALGIWLWEVNAEPVTLVGVTGQTAHTRRIGPVYTPPGHRRRGYASAATAGVSQLLLDRGVPEIVLFTDLDNTTTNHIYQSVGFQQIGAALEILFAPGPSV